MDFYFIWCQQCLFDLQCMLSPMTTNIPHYKKWELYDVEIHKIVNMQMSV